MTGSSHKLRCRVDSTIHLGCSVKTPYQDFLSGGSSGFRTFLKERLFSTKVQEFLGVYLHFGDYLGNFQESYKVGIFRLVDWNSGII